MEMKNEMTSATTKVFTARKILTMNPAQPAATHVAVQNGKIIAVGGEADMAAWPDGERVNSFGD